MSHFLVQPLKIEKVPDGDGADGGHAAEDVDRVIEESAAVRHSGEDRFGEDDLPDVVPHTAERRKFIHLPNGHIYFG